MERIKFPEGDYIYRQEDPSDSIYVVRSGRVDLTTLYPETGEGIDRRGAATKGGDSRGRDGGRRGRRGGFARGGVRAARRREPSREEGRVRYASRRLDVRRLTTNAC